jgi:ferritin-like metal-binding protein YciE
MANTELTGQNTPQAHDEETLLKDLFIDELKDIYWAEQHLVKNMPTMKKEATSSELANAFEQTSDADRNPGATIGTGVSNDGFKSERQEV